MTDRCATGIWALVALALPCALAWGCGGEASGTTSVRAADAGPRSRAAVVTAEPREHRPSWELSGVLEPARTARLGFVVGGRLVKVMVERGDAVGAGEVLGRLDTAEVGAGVAQAEAAVAAAEAQVELAEDALRRLEPLSEEGAVAEAQVVKVRHQREAAVALREQARSALQMAMVKRGQHLLRAPFAGTVLSAPEQVGEIVGPGIPQFDIADLTRLRARVSLPAEAVGLVREGQPAAVVTRRGQRLEGRVASVLPALDPETHRLPVEVEVSPPEGEGGEGLANSFVRVRVEATDAVAAAVLPATCIVRAEETRVFVVDGGVARSRTVSVLASEGDRVVVEGLEPGTTVVDLPPADLADGSRVRP